MPSYDKDYHKRYYEANKERIKARMAEYRKANPAKAKAAVERWFADPANKDRVSEYRKDYYAANSEKIKARARKCHEERKLLPEVMARKSEGGRLWRKENPGKNAAKENKRRAAKRRRLPSWVGADELFLIGEAYELAALRGKATGIKWHVDHFIPLLGKAASGLHTIENLRVVPAVVNLRKQAKLIGDKPDSFF